MALSGHNGHTIIIIITIMLRLGGCAVHERSLQGAHSTEEGRQTARALTWAENAAMMGLACDAGASAVATGTPESRPGLA